MGAISAELIKLKRSLAWPVVVLLPIVLVLAGAATQLARGTQPENGWDTVWLQSVGFYGLFPLAIGIAILGSLVWRVEHRGSNWNALMSSPTPTLRIVVAKALVVAGLTALMQVVLVLAVIAIGKLAFGLPGMLPGQHLGIGLLLMLAAVPAAALQSGLSLFLRSFAAPVAIALVASGISTAALMVADNAALVSPYGVATRTALLGTGSFVDDGTITGGDVAAILIATAVLTVALVTVTTWILERRDTRI
ncbi:MAG: ABC transporter permease [Corynebacterium sp.]|uniref:ABC transporter permease n=1 Tax=Corynebacterium TaxID=1716 RepID=UPI002649C62D|nr:ABC transporter permease [Corynebacterium sp.]MDN6304495.1 ABC transporter permease [Corynebacterium sp.]MDN6353244.1 ABC transporter permease [Corynebacterium sp.]MDN6366306.1 ABC transporter permease [Corynebacterium sp.]MDN6395088.1 ABC transporter permease [Corynebacterium sp.]